MAIGIENPVIGYTAFCIIKFVGYAIFFKITARKIEPQIRVHWIHAGLIRTTIGIIIGGTSGYFLTRNGINPIPIYLLILPVVRYIEWSLVFSIVTQAPFFYGRYIIYGIMVSYLLDIPSLFGFIISSGLWVC